ALATGPVGVLDISGLAVLQESPKRATARRYALKRPPASGDFITVTDCMGNRVYLCKTQEGDEQVLTNTQLHTD
ncbi:chromosome transmission fidelity protein 18 homolog, partial [Tachysurus ichikawai]